MFKERLPWDDIKTPDNDISVRQLECESGLPIYWGKDSLGRCIFMVEFFSDVSDVYNKNSLSIHGLIIDLRALKTTRNQGLILILEKHIDQDLFFSLCESLVSVLSGVVESSLGISIALSQMKRWKAFLAGKQSRMLSEEEVRGLFCELKFLQQMLRELASEVDALEAWQGPEISHQDFIFSNTAVEVKSLSGRERNAVKISSEDQLESLSSNLFLKVFRLIDMPEAKGTSSLNELVRAIETSLTEAEAIETFDAKLAKAGYLPMIAYEKPKFIVGEELTFYVGREFPRIARSELNSGLTRVTYEIKLESIQDYLCAGCDIWGK